MFILCKDYTQSIWFSKKSKKFCSFSVTCMYHKCFTFLFWSKKVFASKVNPSCLSFRFVYNFSIFRNNLSLSIMHVLQDNVKGLMFHLLMSVHFQIMVSSLLL